MCVIGSGRVSRRFAERFKQKGSPQERFGQKKFSQEAVRSDMICGACGHWNDDQEHRCAHCGRSVELNPDSSWKRTGLDESPGPMPVKRGSGASVRPWRHEISRRLDEYRDKQRVDGPEFQALAPTERPPDQPMPNVVSIDRAVGDRPPSERLPPLRPPPQQLLPEQQRPEQRLSTQLAARSGYAAMARPGQRVPDLPSIPPVRREHALESGTLGKYLPSIGRGEGTLPAPIAADHLPPPALPRAGGLQCKATVAPLKIRMLAGVLDAAMLVVALGTFLAVFHWFGGRWIADNGGVRALGFASFVLVAFYWGFYVGHFGRTPGMAWMGLRLVNFYGQKPSATQRAARALGLILSSATLGLGFAWSFADEEKLTWHDRMSRTFLTCDGVQRFQLRSPVPTQALKDPAPLLPDLPPVGQI